MNEEVENLVGPNPEQYTRILKLLKTRKEGRLNLTRATICIVNPVSR